MFHRAVCAATLVVLTGCSATYRSQPAPQWFTQPPSHDAQNLYFIGDSSAQPSESTARSLAVQKALFALSQYCGATVQTNFRSVEAERNGKYEQSVSLAVNIAGEELTIREAQIQATTVRRNASTGFDSFALIRWPRNQFEGVLTRQRARGQRSLALYRKAQAQFEKLRIKEAQTQLNEARQLLHGIRTEVSLNDPQVPHTGLLLTALGALEQQVQTIATTRQRIVAVGMACSEKHTAVVCPPHRIGQLREQIVGRGLEVAAAPVEATLARSIAEASAPSEVSATLRDARYLLAVAYDIVDLGEADGFTFAECSARGALYDTEQATIIDTTEIPAKKGGHLHFAGASAKGCDEAEQVLLPWVRTTLALLQPIAPAHAQRTSDTPPTP